MRDRVLAYLVFGLVVLLGLSGCVTDPYQQARINTCSAEANAYSVSSRIGNSAYWSCLSREEYKHNNPPPAPTQAQSQGSQIQSRITAGNKAAGECSKNNTASPAGQIVTKSILIFNDSQENKFDLLTSKARLNDAQKKALKQYLADNAPCRKSKIDGYAGTPYQTIQMRADSDKDMVYAKLLTGQMTVGDANTTLKQINLKYFEDLKTAAANFNQNLQSQSNAELANRQQQQAIAIQQQQQQQIIDQQKRQADLDAYKAYTAPPPPMNIVQPGLTNQNRIQCNPNGVGGFNCR